MSSEKILKKSTFGGFKKEGVLNYIEELQTEILSLKKELNNSKANQKEIDALNDKVKQYEVEISSLKSENEELKISNKTYCEDLSNARNSVNELESKINIYETKFAEIEKKFTEIENSYVTKTVEYDNKASLLMQDAVNYSEKLILKANESAKASVLKADVAVKNAFAEVADASRNIKSARNEYDNSVTALENCVENLSDVLSEISKKLNLSYETEEK